MEEKEIEQLDDGSPYGECAICRFPFSAAYQQGSTIWTLGNHYNSQACLDLMREDRDRLLLARQADAAQIEKLEAENGRYKQAMRRMHCNACGRSGGDGYIGDDPQEAAEPCMNCSTDETLTQEAKDQQIAALEQRVEGLTAALTDIKSDVSFAADSLGRHEPNIASMWVNSIGEKIAATHRIGGGESLAAPAKVGETSDGK